MQHFVELLNESLFKFELIQILQNSKPFRHFKIKINNSEFREQWFDFKRNETEKMVEIEQLRLYHLQGLIYRLIF
jgi:predicted metal-binding protein